MTPKHFEIEIADSSGAIASAQIFCEVEYIMEGAISRRVCSIQLNWNSHDLYSTADDFFAAFSGIREQLEMIGASPLCYAASRNVYPSGLLRDMALGLKAYKHTLNKRVETSDTVDIFEHGSDLEIVTVEEQDRFHKEWLHSLSDLYTEISNQEH